VTETELLGSTGVFFNRLFYIGWQEKKGLFSLIFFFKKKKYPNLVEIALHKLWEQDLFLLILNQLHYTASTVNVTRLK